MIEIQDCIALCCSSFSSSVPFHSTCCWCFRCGWPFGFNQELLSLPREHGTAQVYLLTHLRSIDSDCVLIGLFRYIKRLIYTAILLAPPTEICFFLLSLACRSQDAQLFEVVNWQKEQKMERNILNTRISMLNE